MKSYIVEENASCGLCRNLLPGIISVYTVLMYNIRALFLNAQFEACRVFYYYYDRSLVHRPHTPVVFVEFYVRQNQPIVVCPYFYNTILVLDKNFGCVPLV